MPRAPKTRRVKPTKRRETQARRMRNTRTWRRLARAFRRENPLCHDCLEQGYTAPATETHHIRKVTEYPELAYDWDNLMALCRRCHSIRTARGE